MTQRGVEEIAQYCIFGDMKKEIHADIASIKERVIEALIKSYQDGYKVGYEDCQKEID